MTDTIPGLRILTIAALTAGALLAAGCSSPDTDTRTTTSEQTTTTPPMPAPVASTSTTTTIQQSRP
jgi:hypothetical protein